MAVTLTKGFVPSIMEVEKVKHYNSVKHKAHRTINYDEYLYEQRANWSVQELELVDQITAEVPLSPPSHNPNPVMPEGTGQKLPGQLQAPRIQQPATEIKDAKTTS